MEENLATSRQIPLIRTVVGEKPNMEDIGTSWYPKGNSVANRALFGAGLEVGDVMVFKATNTESSGRLCRGGRGGSGHRGIASASLPATCSRSQRPK